MIKNDPSVKTKQTIDLTTNRQDVQNHCKLNRYIQTQFRKERKMLYNPSSQIVFLHKDNRPKIHYKV